ncbi:MAG: hypothetical protein Q9M89_08235 [Persephonella sp.]|nr:hypothetical protein [Persephonella sp.]
MDIKQVKTTTTQKKDGLFQHSIDVANRMLDIFLENEDKYLPRFENEKTGAYQTRKEKFLFHLALTGLLHDIGKIAVYQVETAYYYVPFITSLKDVKDSLITEKENKKVNYTTLPIYLEWCLG